MKPSEYMAGALETAIFPEIDGSMLVYPAIGLADEAGEVLGKVKKIYRDHEGSLYEGARVGLLAELGDVTWYLAVFAHYAGLDFEAEVERMRVARPAAEPTSLAQAALMLARWTGALAADVLQRTYFYPEGWSESDVENWRRYVGMRVGIAWRLVGEIASALGFGIEEVLQANRDKLASRAARGVLQGSGDVR